MKPGDAYSLSTFSFPVTVSLLFTTSYAWNPATYVTSFSTRLSSQPSLASLKSGDRTEFVTRRCHHSWTISPTTTTRLDSSGALRQHIRRQRYARFVLRGSSESGSMGESGHMPAHDDTHAVLLGNDGEHPSSAQASSGDVEASSIRRESEHEEKGGNRDGTEMLTSRQGNTLDKQLKLFIEMSTPFFKEDSGARWLLGGVVALTLLNSGVSVAFSYIGRDFWTALSNKDPAQFNVMLQRFLLALTAGVPVTVFYRYQRSVLALAWREWMTKRVMEIYYNGQTYYALEASREIDNPDQRIAEDVKAFTQVSLDFLITILTSCIDLVSFSSILYSIYPELFGAIIAYASVGTLVTTKLGGRLVGLNFVQLQTEADFRYSLIRVRENAESIAFYGGVQQELKEIKRRFERALDNFGQVIRAQRNLEFFTTGYRYLIQLLDGDSKSLDRHYNMMLQDVLPGFVVAPLFFQGKIELGVVSQSYGAFNHILSDLSLVVNQFESLSAFSAGVDRLGEFLERMEAGESALAGPLSASREPAGVSADKAASAQDVDSQNVGQEKRNLLASPGSDAHASPAPSGGVQHVAAGGIAEATIDGSRLVVETVPGSRLSVENVTVMTPTGGRVLVEGLTFALGLSERMLIVGESGAGKSSLLRAMAGLWTTGSGKIVRPTTEDTFFLPQRPYCTLGPLRDQITYPSSPSREVQASTEDDGTAAREKEDEELLELLEKTSSIVCGSRKRERVSNMELEAFGVVDLRRIAVIMGEGDAHAGLDAVRDWSDMLSLGEQQRLAFARLLYNKPALAILDESTSALDLNNEARMFALLGSLPDLSVVSVGHRPSLLKFHDTKLKLASSGFTIESTASVRETREHVEEVEHVEHVEHVEGKSVQRKSGVADRVSGVQGGKI